MAEKQELFWISKKSTFGTGENALKYGDEVGDNIPPERIPKHKAAGEVGTIEAATPEGVKVDEAFAIVEKELESAKEKLLEYEIFSELAESVLKKDKLKKDDKELLISKLEALK